MSNIELTAYSGAILGPIAKFLGWIMNGIYVLMYNLFGIENIGLSIILLTILIYMCLLPLTIKQQKFSKLSQKMQPEIQEIQNKYKNKKDQASIAAMNQETQLVYQKYGVSPAGSCVQLLIQMPILLALYRVFYNVPAYVKSVKLVFSDLVSGITATSGFQDKMQELMDNFNVRGLNVNFDASGDTLNNYVIDVLYKLPSTGWEKLQDYFPNLTDSISKTLDHIQHSNYIMMLNISDTPWSIMTTNFKAHDYLFVFLALMIPVLSYVTQVINTKMMPQSTNNNDQMAQQMKTMNIMMPLFSFFICFTVPVGLGIYWIAGAVCRAVQQFFINKHIENLDLDDLVRKNQEKLKKKQEKLGIYGEQIREAAQIKTRTIESKAKVNETSAERELQLEKANEKKTNAKKGSMAAKANMVREFNERNSRK